MASSEEGPELDADRPDGEVSPAGSGSVPEKECCHKLKEGYKMAEKKKGKNGQSVGGRAPHGAEREKQLQDAMEEVNNCLLDAIAPLSVLRLLSDPSRDIEIDCSAAREIGEMTIRIYEAVNTALDRVIEVV
jgi:hypothetical protein